MKISLLIMLSFLSVTTWADVFEVTGTSCVDPIWNESANIFAAEQRADQLALKKCYPFQMVRLESYVVGYKVTCPPHFYGTSVTAKYNCAGE